MTDAFTSRADLVVIGAGPKAAAIAAKAHVLNELGHGPVRVGILEQHEAAAAWTGRNGFTTGAERLGTRPEKDVGFPYQSGRELGVEGREIDAMMFLFSWQSYLVGLGEYRHWVDAGAPCPQHREVARYYAWVLSQATNGVNLRLGKVTGVALRPNGWVVTSENANGIRETSLAERGVVLTGPGKPRQLSCAPDVADRVITPAMTLAQLRASGVSVDSKICIAGSGESAVTLALLLIDEFGDDIDLAFVTPSLPQSRAESFLENAVYSNPQSVDWQSLPESERLEFIRRSDRGVMSPDAVAHLSHHRKLRFVVGRAGHVERSPSGRAWVGIVKPNETVHHEFDVVANCTGSSPLATLTDLLGNDIGGVERRVGLALNDEIAVRSALDENLALRGLAPKLHLPAIAGLLHGPGLANLSCLGTLSDRILGAYLRRPVAMAPRGAGEVDSPAYSLEAQASVRR
ncbi:MAG: SidA/IucD/PvdA family monooxygenase [Gemmatimonadaceae bacterium]